MKPQSCLHAAFVVALVLVGCHSPFEPQSARFELDHVPLALGTAGNLRIEVVSGSLELNPHGVLVLRERHRKTVSGVSEFHDTVHFGWYRFRGDVLVVKYAGGGEQEFEVADGMRRLRLIRGTPHGRDVPDLAILRVLEYTRVR